MVEALSGKLFDGDEKTPATDDEVDGFASFIVALDLLSSVDSKTQDRRDKDKDGNRT